MADEQLRVTEGNALGEQLSVEADVLIGRAASEAVGRLGDDPEISRRHARVWRGTEGELRIEDLGSANGTFVNGERIDDTRTLHIGDVVRVGQTVLTVTDASGAHAAADPAELEAGGGPAAGGHRRRGAGPAADAGGRVHDRARRERGGAAGRRRGAVAPPRAPDAGHRRAS